MMRWPWAKSEKRSAGGFSDQIVRLLEQQAAGTAAASTTATAAVEAGAGQLSRAFAAAEVEGPEWGGGSDHTRLARSGRTGPRTGRRIAFRDKNCGLADQVGALISVEL